MKEYISKKYEIVARLQLRGKHFEFWLPIKDFPNYEVSTEGRVRNIRTRKVLKPNVSGRSKTFSSFRLSNQDERVNLGVAQIVLETFSKLSFHPVKIIHLDGDSFNNSLSNLEYLSDYKQETESKFIILEEFPTYMINTRGQIFSKLTGKKLTQYFNKDGYTQITFRYKGKTILRSVAKLVAKTFIPNPNNYPHINHINGIKTDNRVENLEWKAL